jgi:hypothetical protein
MKRPLRGHPFWGRSWERREVLLIGIGFRRLGNCGDPVQCRMSQSGQGIEATISRRVVNNFLAFSQTKEVVAS